jgi:hypothetical protein
MIIRTVIAITICMCATLPAYAAVTVTDAWVKITAPGQTAVEAYMQIRSDAAAKLVGVSSPTAKIVQIHEMKMNGNVMQMRAINSIDLPAGQTVVFKPGGYHIMLSEISPPLKPGAMLPLTLTVEDADMHRQSIEVKVEVRSAMSMDKPDDMKDMGGMKGM